MKFRKRILRGVAGFFAGIAVLSMTNVTAYAASGIKTLADFNQGAAIALDSVDHVDDESFFLQEDDSGGEEDDEDDDAMSGIVMADVKNQMNVREEPTTESKKVGLLYADCGGTILDSVDGWTKIESGKLVGWACNDYLLFGDEAEELAKSVGHTLATIDTDALRVRKDMSEESGIYGLVAKGDVIEVNVENSNDEWLAIEFEGDQGFINAEYVNVEFKVDAGETIEEIKEREKKEKEEKAKLIANLGPVAIGTTEDVLLGALIQCEAGNQPYEGQLAVASVVMNRVRSGAYPNTVSGVIYASGQFGPAGSGKVEAQVNRGVKESCMQAAREAIAGKTNIGTATHFRRAGVHEGIVIGDHVFW